jgi:hypothetical protein
VNWAGISIAIGLVVLAAAAGPVGWVVLAAGAVWLWRRG